MCLVAAASLDTAALGAGVHLQARDGDEWAMSKSATVLIESFIDSLHSVCFGGAHMPHVAAHFEVLRYILAKVWSHVGKWRFVGHGGS